MSLEYHIWLGSLRAELGTGMTALSTFLTYKGKFSTSEMGVRRAKAAFSSG